MKLCTYKETTIMNNLTQKKSICHKVKKFRLNGTRILGSTLCYCNVDDYDICNL